MTIATKQPDTERRVAQAVRQILGDDTDAWVANAGPERLAARLRSASDATAQPERETFIVTLEGWRTSERTVPARPNGNLHAWLHALVGDPGAFGERFEHTEDARSDDHTLGMTALRVTRIKRRHAHIMAWSSRHTSWTSETEAHDALTRMREPHITTEATANGVAIALRLGRASAVERTTSVTARAQTTPGEIAAMARTAASVIAPQRWSETNRWTPVINYIAWVQIDGVRYTPPPATRLMRQYIVRVARLREEQRTVIMEGPREDHVPMLEDAVSVADGCTDWSQSPGFTCDYVDRYRTLDGDDGDSCEEVPDGLRMLERI